VLLRQQRHSLEFTSHHDMKHGTAIPTFLFTYPIQKYRTLVQVQNIILKKEATVANALLTIIKRNSVWLP
jgi:hypothetical protein